MSEQFDAAELVEALAEALKPEPPPGPKYISIAEGLNRAQRRALMKLKARSERRFETWKRQLIRAGIDWEAVLAERRARAEREKAA